MKIVWDLEEYEISKDFYGGPLTDIQELDKTKFPVIVYE